MTLSLDLPETEKVLTAQGWRLHCEFSDCYVPGDLTRRPSEHIPGVVSSLLALCDKEVQIVSFPGSRTGETICRLYCRKKRG